MGAENINLKLLEDMTATVWPDQVFAMNPVADGHSEASTIFGALC